MARVVVCDDHPLFRAGLRAALEDAGHRVVAEAATGHEGIAQLREHEPDVAVLDLSMPELDGMEVLAQTRTWPRPPLCVVLTMHEQYATRASELGARGYLLKEDAASHIASCLQAVLRGETYASPSLGPWPPAPTSGTALAELTDGERRVLRLVAQHKTSREIAEVLHVSTKTVQNHRASMVRKLALSGSQALLRYALSQREALDVID